MAPKPKKFMDALDALSDDNDEGSSASASGSDAEEGKAEEQGDEAAKEPAAKKRKEITLEDLERVGYRAGPSVLYMKAPQEQQQTNWQWSDGSVAKEKEEEEGRAERAATRAAVEDVEESAAIAVRAMEYANKLREDARAERQQLAAAGGKGASFNQKEKRKRDLGQASRGKSTVEESKRQAREFGVYSGFD